MILVSDEDGNYELSDFDNDIADKDCIPSEADMSQSLQDANVDIYVASLETTEVDEITEPVSIESWKRKSDFSNRKNVRSDSYRKGKKYTDCKGNEKAAREPKAQDCSTCCNKYSENFPEVDWILICNEYWSLGD